MDEVLDKEINQIESVEKETTETIRHMGAIWQSVTKKLIKDNVCYFCKKELGDSKIDIVEVPEDKISKGLFAIVSVCKKCKSK